MRTPRRVPGDEYRVFTVERTWGIVRAVFERPLRALFRMRVYGVDRIPRHGGAVLAVNHIAGADIVLIAISQPRTIRYMAKAELFTYNRALTTVIRHGGTFAVRRGEPDREALRTARAVVRAGHLLGMFVEGTRQESEQIGTVMPGAALVSIAENVPIVPCVIQGSIYLKQRPWHPVTVVYGEPIEPSVVSGQGKVEALTQLLDAELRSLQRFAQSAIRAGRPRSAVAPQSGAYG